MELNAKTQAAVNALAIMGIRYVKRTPAHCYFDVPSNWTKEQCAKLAKEFIRQTGIGVKMRVVKA